LAKTDTSPLIWPLYIMNFVEISNFDSIKLKFCGFVVDIVNIQNKKLVFSTMRTIIYQYIIKKEKVIDNGDFPI